MTSRLGDSFKDADANRYDRYRPKYALPVIGKIYTELGIKPDMVIADIGAGTGFLSIPLVGNNVVYHVDASKPMNDIARKKYSEMKHEYYRDRLKVIDADGVDIVNHIPPSSVDVVLMSNAAHWFSGDNSKPFKNALEKICKPGAKVIIGYNAYSREDSRTNQVFSEIEAIFPTAGKNSGIGGISKEKMERGINVFVAPIGQKRYHEERVDALSLEEFIGYVGTISFAIQDGIDSQREKALSDIFDKYCEGEGDQRKIKLKLTTDLICGDKLDYSNQLTV